MKQKKIKNTKHEINITLISSVIKKNYSTFINATFNREKPL